MKIETLPKEFEEARPIMQTIEAAGFEAYFVGGSVRDTLLHKEIHDVDIATSAYPEEVKALFHKTVDTGIEHGTVMILDHGIGYETTTFRTEATYQDYRRPDSVTFVRSLKEDLKRRDFTINALAMRENGEIIDLFAGLDDLNNGIIKAVGNPEERFNEDALRMMRAVRFASQLNFKIEVETEKAIKNHAELLEKIAVERIQVEFIKMLLGQEPAVGLVSFVETGLFQYCPDFKDAQSALESMIKIADLRLPNEATAWGLICHLLNFSSPQTSQFLKNWKTSNQMIESVLKTTKALNAILENRVDNWMLYQTGRTELINAINLAQQLFAATDEAGLLTQYDNLQIKSKKELALTGKDLMTAGVKPGPQMGQILAEVERKVVENELTNSNDVLTEYVRNRK